MIQSYSLGSVLSLTLDLQQPRFGLAPGDLFKLAVRQNTKRGFLFVSRVLGKHLPIDPAAMLCAGRLLAMAWTGEDGWAPWASVLQGGDSPPFEAVLTGLEQTRRQLGQAEQTLFIGFAETATGLAQAVADSFCGHMGYISSTRLALPGITPLCFDEAHSHARNHMLHLAPADAAFLKGCTRAVLVDDELTTGNTALRLIERLHAEYGIRRFALLSLLDFSAGENRRKAEARLGVEIEAVSLLRGQLIHTETGELPASGLENLCSTSGAEPDRWQSLSCGSGSSRRLLQSGDLDRQRQQCRTFAQALDQQAEPVLFLGAGELIYAPCLIAGLCRARAFHSTTQSPVLPLDGSAISSGVRFDPPDCYSAAGYLYNIPYGAYRSAVLLAEQELLRAEGLRQLTAYLRTRGVEKVTVATV